MMLAIEGKQESTLMKRGTRTSNYIVSWSE
jgi:hypothetical protein